jgi:acyl-CoA thioester hydrolase
VRYAETDQMGIAHHANYFIWFEIGRTDLLRSLGWTYREMEASGVALPVIDASCVYSRPVRYDDEVIIATTGRLLSSVRIAFTYELHTNGQAAPAATGRTEHAAVSGGRPCRLPARVREVFA